MDIACAKCGSHDLESHTQKTLLGAQVLITCLKCGHRFQPGFDKDSLESEEGQKKAKTYARNLLLFFVFIVLFGAFLAYYYFKAS